jgi:hypothetical protein
LLTVPLASLSQTVQKAVNKDTLASQACKQRSQRSVFHFHTFQFSAFYPVM